MNKLIAGLVTAATLLLSTAAISHEHESAAKALADSKLKAIVADAQVIGAINAQNAKTSGLDEAAIIALDKKWRAETKASTKPMIDGVLANALSKYLAAAADGSEGLFTEIFVMDAKGLNVGQSGVTSDYWQGDEAKWKKTFLAGNGAVFIDKVEEDESTQTFQSQVSIAITDPASGKVIGAVTFGINIEQLGG